MNVLEFALKREKESEETYRQLAKESKSEGLRKIFKMLAEEESNHFLVVEEIKYDLKVLSPLSGKIDPEAIVSYFVNDESGFYVPENELETYKECLKVEEQSRDFYKDEAKKARSAEVKEALLLLAEEEHKHMMLLENIIEHVSHPGKKAG